MLFDFKTDFDRIQRFLNKEKRRKPYFVFMHIFNFNNGTEPIIPSNLTVYPMLKLLERY